MKTSWVLIPIAGLIAFALGGAVAVTEDTPSPQARTSVRSQGTIPDQNEATTVAPSPIATEVEEDKMMKNKDEGPGEGHAYGHDRGSDHGPSHPKDKHDKHDKDDKHED